MSNPNTKVPIHIRIRSIAELITSDGMISWRFAAWVIVVSTLITSIPPAMNDGSTLVARVFAGLVSIIAMVAVLLLLWFVLLHRLTGPARIVTTLVAYVVVGALRGFILYRLLNLSGTNVNDSELVFRVLPNATQMLVILSIGSYVVEVSRRQRKKLALIQARQAEVEEIVVRVSREAQASEAHILDEIRQHLDTVRTPESAADAVQLREFSRNVIRPLSHQLASQIPSIETPQFTANQFRVPLREFWHQIPFTEYIRPGLTTTVTFVGWIGALAALFTQGTVAVTALLLFPLWYVSLWIVKWITSKFSSPPSPAALLTACVLVLISSLPPLTFVVALQPFPIRNEMLTAVPVQSTEYVILIAVATAIHIQNQQVNRKLKAAQRELDWTITRAQLVQWHHNGRIARTLHGPVRAELMASWMTLNWNDQSAPQVKRSVTEGASDSIYDSIQQRISNLVEQQDEIDVGDSVRELAQLWRDTCVIDFTETPDAHKVLDNDVAAADLAQSIVQDAIANSINHGAASKIEVSLSLASPDLLEIVVADDGTKRRDPSAQTDGQAPATGLGTAQLKACAIEWDRTLLPDSATLTAVLPVE